jgi:hypothetical protein
MQYKRITAREAFKTAYGGSKNLMTDNVIGYRAYHNFYFEIASGRGIESSTLYGLSVLEMTGEKLEPRNDLSTSADSLEKIEDIIKGIKKNVKTQEQTADLETIRQPILKELREMFEKTNKTIYGSVKRVSSSGMYRVIHFFAIVDGRPCNLDNEIIKLGLGDARDGGVGVGGCGMDMVFSVIYNLSSMVYRGEKDAGYILKEGSA